MQGERKPNLFEFAERQPTITRSVTIPMVAASERGYIAFQLSGDQCHDAPQILCLFENQKWDDLVKQKGVFMAMDWRYEDDLIRKLVFDSGFIPIVPPKSNRKVPWEYDKEHYKYRYEARRLFRRLKVLVCTGHAG